MAITIELVGGPVCGRRMQLDAHHAPQSYRVPLAPDLGSLDLPQPEDALPIERCLVYELELHRGWARRNRDGCYRYQLRKS